MLSLLAVLASCALIGAYAFYIRAMAKGEIPHPVTTTVWTVWVVLNAVTYRAVASSMAQWFTVSQQICMGIMFLLTVVALARHGWARVRAVSTFDRWDVVLGLAVIGALLYKFSVDSPETQNLVAQVAAAISFVSVAKMAYAGTQKMSPWPWALGSLAYALQFIVAWPSGPAALAYPTVNIIGHAVVWHGTVR